jgi:hypothetical protein
LAYQFISTLLGISVAQAEITPPKDPEPTYNLAEAVREVKKTGRPMFAVTYSDTCSICKGLLKTLDTETSLRPVAAQFVHARINVESPEFRGWERDYPRPSSAIPGVYVINSDGKALVVKAGGQTVDDLQNMLTESLQQSGRLPNAEQLAGLAAAADAAKPAVEAGEFQQAMLALEPVERDLARMYDALTLTSEGEQIRSVVDAIVAHALEDLTRANEASTADLWTSAWLIASTTGDFGVLPGVKEKSDEARESFSRTAAQKQLLRQARELYRAQQLYGPARSARGRAALQKIITKSPGTAAAQQAAAILAGQSVERPENSAGTLRKWTDRSGKSSVMAEYMGTSGDKVRLKRADGKIVSVPLDKLSEESQHYVRTREKGI